MKYIIKSNVKKKAKELDKQLSADAIHALDCIVDTILEKACRVHNGGKKRIDATVINFTANIKPE